MPAISIFFGIIIRMYHDEHPPPYFHASYQGFEAFVRISDGEIMHGSLPKKAAKIVKRLTKWIRLRAEEEAKQKKKEAELQAAEVRRTQTLNYYYYYVIVILVSAH